MEKDILLNKYLKTRKNDVRNKLVERYLSKVDELVLEFNKDKDLDYNELLSYGYEGLLMGIKNYNRYKGDFEEYIFDSINNYLINGEVLLDNNEFYNIDYSLELKEIINKLEKDYNKKIYEDNSIINDVVNIFMTKHNNINKQTLLNYIYMKIIPLSLNDNKRDYIKFYDINKRLYMNDIKEQIKKLPPKHQYVIEEVYYENKLNQMLTKDMNLTKQRISKIKLDALKKLRSSLTEIDRVTELKCRDVLIKK